MKRDEKINRGYSTVPVSLQMPTDTFFVIEEIVGASTDIHVTRSKLIADACREKYGPFKTKTDESKNCKESLHY